MSSGNRVKRVLLVMLASALVAACGEPAQPAASPSESTSALPSPQFPNYPAQANDFRFHWTAAPGIDLTTGPAVAVRAYLESIRLAAFAFGDRSAVYPGFLYATPENVGAPGEDGSTIQLQRIRPKTRAEYETDGVKPVERQLYGYQPTHILSLEPRDDAYRATVCTGTYSTYRTSDVDRTKFFSILADETTGQLAHPGMRTVDVWRIELTDNDLSRAAAPDVRAAPQAGPMPAPVDDVFGRWFITGASSVGWGTIGGDFEVFETPVLQAQCAAAMPDDAAARLAMATGFHTAPPPHGAPVPGWPAEAR